jgi:hypothetical protein
MLTPPRAAPDQLGAALAERGFAVLGAADALVWAHIDILALQPLQSSWDRLPPDRYLRDGGRYRRRRHASYIVQDGVLRPVAHRPHWQPVEYNALHGGLERWFEPVEPAVAAAPAWQALVAACARQADCLRGPQPWHVEAHQFRIDTAGGIGRPTPEGAHRDGVDLVAVFLVRRHGIKGGETRVFSAHGPEGLRFTLSEPWSVMLLDDERVIHETTPIQPERGDAVGFRDTLVVTLRAGGFQGPA